MTSENVQKKCGFCGESIPMYTRRCPYCGSILEVTIDNDYNFTPPGNNTANNGETMKPEDAQQLQDDTKPLDWQAQEQQVQEQQPKEQPPREQQASYKSRIQGVPYSQGGSEPDGRAEYGSKNTLSNGMKVFLTVLFTIIPGIGQLAGIITAIVFMNSEGDSDRKSFGIALLVASLIMFVFACIGCFIMVIAISSSNQFTY